MLLWAKIHVLNYFLLKIAITSAGKAIQEHILNFGYFRICSNHLGTELHAVFENLKLSRTYFFLYDDLKNLGLLLVLLHVRKNKIQNQIGKEKYHLQHLTRNV